jgi:hypothetical protein
MSAAAREVKNRKLRGRPPLHFRKAVLAAAERGEAPPFLTPEQELQLTKDARRLVARAGAKAWDDPRGCKQKPARQERPK